MRKMLYLILLLGISGCDDFCDNYLTKAPTSDVASENYWKTETDVETAIRQVYAIYAQHFGGTTMRLTRNRALPFDYLSATWLNVSKNYLQLRWAKNAAAISWKNEYNIISEINKVLYYIGRAEMPEERLNIYTAQLKTMRAMVYYYIVQTWGDCPYKTDYFDIEAKARIPEDQIYKSIVSDLEESIPFLPRASEIKNADGSTNVSKMIPAKGTGYMYLSQIYAFQGVKHNDNALLQKALAAADSVITSGDYSLVQTVKDVCEVVLKGNSPEGIHEIDFYAYNNEYNNHNACMFAPTVQYPVVPNSTPQSLRSGARLSYNKAKEIFSPLDDWWVNALYDPENMLQKSKDVYIYKHRNTILHEDGVQKGRIRALDENEIVYRLPDAYLTVAEMYARLGNSDMAKNYLNVIRRRANGPDYSESEGDLLRAIFKMWVKERFMEGFDTEFYLRLRFGYCNELPGDFSTETDPESLYLPVGEYAFLDNPYMKQNNYWMKKEY